MAQEKPILVRIMINHVHVLQGARKVVDACSIVLKLNKNACFLSAGFSSREGLGVYEACMDVDSEVNALVMRKEEHFLKGMVPVDDEEIKALFARFGIDHDGQEEGRGESRVGAGDAMSRE